MPIFDELRRRHVFRVAIAYAIVAWLLVQVASVFVPALRLPDWVLTLVALLLILGFPVAVFLAWAYELTPEGVHRAGAIEVPHPARKLVGRRLDFTIIALLLAVLVFLGVDHFLLERRESDRPVATETGTASVAVLPFVSISGDPEQEYFSDGISEELSTVLARVPGLRVPSRTSSFSFKDTNTPIETIASELSVDHVLEGSVRRSGSQLRISANLIDVADNRSLWSQTFDRELTNVFEIQNEIAERVAEVLQIRLVRARDNGLPRTENPEAHDEYLKGLAQLATQASADVLQSIERFENAIELDPQYAAAYAMLASAYNVAVRFDFLPPERAIAGAEAAVARALELDPLLARAYYERSLLTNDPAVRLSNLQRAAELGLNNSDAHLSRSQALLVLGRRAEARVALEEAVSLDPRSVQLNWMMGSLRLNLGDRIGARGYYRRTIDLQPTSPVAYAGMGDVETAEGRLDEAVRWYVAGLEQDPGQPHMTTWVGILYLSLGDEAFAEIWFERGADLLQGHGSAEEFFLEFIPLVRNGSDPERLIALVQDVSPALFGPFGSRMFRKAVLASGSIEDARRYYEEFWPELFDGNPVIGNDNFHVVTDVVWLLRSEGTPTNTEAMLDEAHAVLNENEFAIMYPSDLSASVLEFEILAMLGREDEALRAMRRAIDNGWRFGWWQLEVDPVLASIRYHPEFEAMLVEIQADMAGQLESMPDYLPPSISD